MAIGLAVIANGKASLGSAMTEGLRLAATRGDLTLMGNQAMIAPVTAFISGSDLTASGLSALLVSGDVPEDEAKLFLNQCVPTVYGIDSLAQLPPPILYTLIYINQALRQSIGSSLRFPCVPPGGDPPPNSSNCPTTGSVPGCAACYLINPQQLNYTAVGSPPSPNFFAIRCEYSPSNIFLDPIMKGLALLTGISGGNAPGIVISRDRVFEVTRLGG
ncbi:MAG: hypothetical protein RL417_1365 [Pseudomonadota bacterium]